MVPQVPSRRTRRRRGGRAAFTVTTVVEGKDRRHTEIWMAPTDGSALLYRFTSPSFEAGGPTWSPDGSLIAFTSHREGADDDVWFLRTGPFGGEAYQVTGVHALPAFSPDGRQLLYAWRGKDSDSLKQQPWRERVSPIAVTRGTDPKRFDGRVYTSLPFLADERGLIPPRETRRPAHLYAVAIDGGTPLQLTDGDLSQTQPAWSPDGKQVAFVQDSTEPDEIRRDVRPQLYVLTIGDKTARRIETGFVENQAPDWSPDGRALAFVCSKGRGEENDVCVVPTAGGAVRSLTATWALDPQNPSWSPDGKTVYFSAETHGNVHLFAVPAAGGPVRQVTQGERTLRGFSLSRDGRTLAYTASDVTHPAELFVAPTSGGPEKRLTTFNDAWLGHDAPGGAGRLLRRVHDQLGRRPHQPFRGGGDRPLDLQLVFVVRLVGRAGPHRLRVRGRALGERLAVPRAVAHDVHEEHPHPDADRAQRGRPPHPDHERRTAVRDAARARRPG